MPISTTALRALLGRTSSSEAAAWFEAELEAIEQGDSSVRLLAAFAAAGRRMGANPTSSKLASDAELPAWVGTWTSDELARVTLLLFALERLPEGKHVALVEDLYFRGELGEKRAVLLALPFLPNPERHLDVALEACRTNAKSLFEGVATDNPYPERHFSELSYNQLVMKALFLGVNARRIVGVDKRVGPELSRMLDDYKKERLAAGRTVPEDLEWLAAQKFPEGR
jgi:hypothetical protein